jgi:hypothetical protein
MNLTDFHRILHSIAVEYPFSSEDHGTFSKIDHISSHGASLNAQKLKSFLISYQSIRE